MLLKSTTRHIHIFTAQVEKNELIPSEQALTLDVDPDNELVWTEDALRKVYGQNILSDRFSKTARSGIISTVGC
jgi:NAD(P)H-quinone oxidoreductase subunit M